MSEASGSNERMCYNKGCGKRFQDEENNECELHLLFRTVLVYYCFRVSYGRGVTDKLTLAPKFPHTTWHLLIP